MESNITIQQQYEDDINNEELDICFRLVSKQIKFEQTDGKLQIRFEDVFKGLKINATSYTDEEIINRSKQVALELVLNLYSLYKLSKEDKDGYNRVLSLLEKINIRTLRIVLQCSFIKETFDVFIETMNYLVGRDTLGISLIFRVIKPRIKEYSVYKPILKEFIHRTTTRTIRFFFPFGNDDPDTREWRQELDEAVLEPLENRIYPIDSKSKSASKR